MLDVVKAERWEGSWGATNFSGNVYIKISGFFLGFTPSKDKEKADKKEIKYL